MADSRHYRVGQTLLIFAWAEEILAATVGLTIAIVTVMAIHTEREATGTPLSIMTQTNFVLGALPFIMVAIVELVKIPMATAAYHSAKLRWRIFFSASLLFLIFITFETALNGFERNFANLTYSIDEIKREVTHTEEKISKFNSTLSLNIPLTVETVNSQYNTRNDQLEADKARELIVIDQTIQNKRDLSNTGRISALEANLNSVEKQITELRTDNKLSKQQTRAEFTTRTNSVNDSLRSQRVTIEAQITHIDRKLNDLAKQEQQDMADRTFFTEESARQRWKEERQPWILQRASLVKELNSKSVESEISSLIENRDKTLREQKRQYDTSFSRLNLERKDLQRKIAEQRGITDQSLQRDLKTLDERKKGIIEKFSGLKRTHETWRANMLNRSKTENNSKGQAVKELEILEAERVRLRGEINIKVIDNQVYRITALWAGRDNPADITKAELRITAIVWFGSLSAIVATVGVILAFAGLVLKYQHEENGKSPRPLRNSIRRLLISARRRLNAPKIIREEVIVEKTRTVEVVKEVPVQKVVLKEVPREITQLRIVHVPLYTNDKELLGEVADEPTTEAD